MATAANKLLKKNCYYHLRQSHSMQKKVISFMDKQNNYHEPKDSLVLHNH